MNRDERSQMMKKRWANPDFHKMMCKKLKGRNFPKNFSETRSKIQKELWENPEYRKMMCEKIKEQKRKPRTEETKRKISEKLKGHKLSKETIQKIVTNPNYINRRKKNSGQFQKGDKPKITGKTLEDMYGKEKAKNIKRKQRISKINYIQNQKNNGLPLSPIIGKYETKILDYLEESINDKIIRQYPVCGYFLDGYSKLRNIAFEIDEPRHFTEEQMIKDKYRQREIEEELGCTFMRIKVPK